MIENYAQKSIDTFFVVILLWLPGLLTAQSPRVFTSQDFELIGKVKTCKVITDYGKETFEFDEAGLLIKSITGYNEQDYDITYYKYQGEELAERRNEVYRDGNFDKSTSIAHLYEIDTTANKKIIEKIVSYDEDFLDKYEYIFNEEGQLVKVIRTNNEGLDETIIEYTAYKNENTISHYLNGVILKSVRTSFKKKRNGSEQKVELLKDYLEGTPVKAIEKIYDTGERLISEQNFSYDPNKKSFVPDEFIRYNYDDNGRLIKKISEVDGRTAEQEFIYQFDQGDEGNWVKKIVTPENSYITRKIEYYPEEAVEE